MISKFFILGERCSGTNFLHSSLNKNFKLEYNSIFGHKHFFGHKGFPNNSDTLFVGITREITSWINSFYSTPHHVGYPCRENKNAFLTKEFFSCWDSGKNQGKDIVEDYHWKLKRRFKNIFELRVVKNNFLLYEMPKRVNNYILIRYEDLRDDYKNTLDRIKLKFDLEMLHDNYVPITNYKGYANQKVYKKKEIYHFKDIDIINRANLHSEFDLGYFYE